MRYRKTSSLSAVEMWCRFNLANRYRITIEKELNQPWLMMTETAWGDMSQQTRFSIQKPFHLWQTLQRWEQSLCRSRQPFVQRSASHPLTNFYLGSLDRSCLSESLEHSSMHYRHCDNFINCNRRTNGVEVAVKNHLASWCMAERTSSEERKLNHLLELLFEQAVPSSPWVLWTA